MTKFPDALLPLTLTDPLIHAFWNAARAQNRQWDDALAVEVILALAQRNAELTKQCERLLSITPVSILREP